MYILWIRGYATAIDYLRSKGIRIKAVENAKDIIDASIREAYDMAEYDYPDDTFDSEEVLDELDTGLSITDMAFLKSKLTKIMGAVRCRCR